MISFFLKTGVCIFSSLPFKVISISRLTSVVTRGALKIAALIRSVCFLVVCSLTQHHCTTERRVGVCCVEVFHLVLKLPSPQLVSLHLAHSPRTSTPSSSLETEKLFGFIVLVHCSVFQPTLPSAHFAVCARSVLSGLCLLLAFW